jgi:hypothetical protein
MGSIEQLLEMVSHGLHDRDRLCSEPVGEGTPGLRFDAQAKKATNFS